MIEFIAKLKKETKFRSNAILEKSIYAFSLLEGLVKIYPDLIFKGGTSIFIRQFPPIRFSIDVDIILQEKEKEGIEEGIRSIIGKESQFKKVSPDERRNKKNISHYYFYYDSVVSKKEEYILLDILYSDNPYSTIERYVVDLPLIQSGNKFEVIIPSIEGLYADKLVAIADNKLGIPINETFEMQYVKQIVDLHILFPLTVDLKELSKTFKNIVAMENKLHNTNIDYKSTLNSIQRIAVKYAKFLFKGNNDKDEQIVHINNGLNRITSHLVTRFNADKLKEAYGKSAYIAKLILDGDTSVPIEKRDAPLKKYEINFSDEMAVLNTLLKTSPIAYHYFLKTFGN